MKINHVAIAVENVEDAARAYQDALDVKDEELRP
jgi:catechol 2,3-dioxygenase-like lactoylglutathione lyase family enzyme